MSCATFVLCAQGSSVHVRCVFPGPQVDLDSIRFSLMDIGILGNYTSPLVLALCLKYFVNNEAMTCR